MDIDGFESLVDRFGEDLSTWPLPERETGNAFLRESAKARELVERAKLLRRLMTERAPVRAPAGLADRIVIQAVRRV